MHIPDSQKNDFRRRFRGFVWLALIIIALNLTACGNSQPATASPQSDVDYNATIEVARSTIQVVETKQHAPTSPPGPATSTSPPAKSPPDVTPTVQQTDLSDLNSVVTSIQHALQTGNTAIFDALTSEDGTQYTDYIEGSMPVTKQAFINDLQKRFSSEPYCRGFRVKESGDDSAIVWTTGWFPEWEITNFCYTDCSEVNPPRTSSTAAFILHKPHGAWQIKTVWTNDEEPSFLTDGYTALIPCPGEQSAENGPAASPTATMLPPSINLFIRQIASLPGTGRPFPGAQAAVTLIDKVGDYVYLASYGEGLKIIDVSNPTAPHVAGEIKRGSNPNFSLDDPMSLIVKDGIAYLALVRGDILLIDVTNPSQPNIMGRIGGDITTEAMAVGNHFVYQGGQEVKRGGYEALSWDVSDPRNPSALAGYGIRDFIVGMAIDKMERLWVFDNGNATTVFPVDTMSSIGVQLDIDVSFGTGYVWAGDNLYKTSFGRLQVFSAQDESHLDLIGNYGDGQYSSGYQQLADVQGIRIQEKLAFLADYRNGIYVIDIEHPDRMFVRGYHYPDEPGAMRDLEVAGNIIYTTSGNGDLRVFQIDGPGIPLPTPIPTTAPSSSNSTSGEGLFSGKIVFLSDRLHRDVKMGPVDIFVMNPDGSGQTHIPTDKSFPFASSLVASPDGNTVAIGVVNGYPEDKGIFLIDANGKIKESINTDGRGAQVLSWTVADQMLVSLLDRNTGYANLFLYDFNSKTFQQLTNAKVYNQYAAQSPDGKTIAFAHDPDGVLWLMDADGGNQRPLVAMQTDLMAWSPDGRSIAFGRNYRDLFVVDATSGAAQNVTNTPNTYDGNPAWSPDGKKIVFVQSVGQFESNIMIIDLTTGKTTRLTRDAADDWPFWVP